MKEKDYQCHICGSQLDESFVHRNKKVKFEYTCHKCGGIVKTMTYYAEYIWFSNGKKFKDMYGKLILINKKESIKK